jgi:hypothetical protein
MWPGADADIIEMASDPNEQWASVEFTGSLVGRRAGRSAADEAEALRRRRPLASRVERLLGVRTDERAWRRGARGERIAAFWLGRLPTGGTYFTTSRWDSAARTSTTS